MKHALVTGAGGFIGHHLVKRLAQEGYVVTGVDIKYPEFEESAADHFHTLDLRDAAGARCALRLHDADWDEVYALAADMGGMGFISCNHADILTHNLLINLNTLLAASYCFIGKYLYTSSACVYPEYRQDTDDAAPLKEAEAYPADPQDAYGWEKLTTEKLVHHYRQEDRLDSVRVVRFHNVYGPLGTWQGGREKAPAALCRKIATAKALGHDHIEIWGDGQQTRSFMYITDCLEGLRRLMDSDHEEPINLGRDEMISINDLARLIGSLAGWDGELVHVDGPVGVRGRNSDNTQINRVLGWAPTVPLVDGLARTYTWVEAQVLDTL